MSKNSTSRIEQLKKKPCNKSCFDCGEKGTTYVCMNFGTFICSRCAGLLRELNFKVKGTGVSIFKDAELDFLEENGNDNAYNKWMSKFKQGKDKIPSAKTLKNSRIFCPKNT